MKLKDLFGYEVAQESEAFEPTEAGFSSRKQTLYNKEGAALWVVGEKGDNILSIMSPSEAQIPLFEVASPLVGSNGEEMSFLEARRLNPEATQSAVGRVELAIHERQEALFGAVATWDSLLAVEPQDVLAHFRQQKANWAIVRLSGAWQPPTASKEAFDPRRLVSWKEADPKRPSILLGLRQRPGLMLEESSGSPLRKRIGLALWASRLVVITVPAAAR